MVEWKEIGSVNGKSMFKAVDEKKSLVFLTRHVSTANDYYSATGFEILNARTLGRVRFEKNNGSWRLEQVDEKEGISPADDSQKAFFTREMLTALETHPRGVEAKLAEFIEKKLGKAKKATTI